NQMLPSGALVIPTGLGVETMLVGMVSVRVIVRVEGLITLIVPAVVPAAGTVNQTLPSGPPVIPKGLEVPATGVPLTGGLVVVLITPTAYGPVVVAPLSTPAVYQILPSGPSAIPKGSSFEPRGSGPTSLTIWPVCGLRIPMAPNSVNQRLPSEPRTILDV